MTSDRLNKMRNPPHFPPKKQRTILLVDDSEVDRAVYRRYLNKSADYDYHFIEAETGKTALEIYPNALPDLVLLDYFLPDIDGLEWIRRWQQKYNKNPCPVIILTGQGNENIAVKFIQLGAADYLVKDQITAERLNFSVQKELIRQEEKQKFTQIIQSQNEQLLEVNRLLNEQMNCGENSECSLSNNKKKLHCAVFNAPIPVLVHAEDGEIMHVNQTWTELSGYTIEDIPTTAEWTEKAYGRKQKTVKSFIDRLYELNQRVEEGEFKIRTAGGQFRIWNFSSAPLGRLLDGRRLVISCAKDVTEIKQAKIAAQQSEIQFRQTFEQAAVGMAHVAPNGQWLRVNQKLCAILGYNEKELLEKTFQEITYPDDLEPDLAYVRQVLSGEIESYSMEKRYIRKDNACIWMNLTVSLFRNQTEEPEYFICVIENIQKRKNLELSQAQALKRLSNLHQIDKAIIEAQTPQAIATIAINNIQDLSTCQRVSVVTFDSQRQTATTLVTQGIAEQTAQQGLETNLNLWQTLIERLQASEQSYVVSYLSQSPQLLSAMPEVAVSGLDCFICFGLKLQNKLLGILKLWVEDAQEISAEQLTMIEEISIQIAIALQQANLTQASRNYALELENKVRERTTQLEEINQELKAFTYSISHDLKAPLRAIQGFAIALQEDYADKLDELGQEYTSRLATSAEQMERLIQDLLAYSRLSRTEIYKKPVNLTSVVNKALEDLEIQITEVKAEITVDRPLLNVLGNRTILQQIVENLLSNALKFTSSKVKPQIHIRTEEYPENVVRLWIEDNGIGIEAQHQERIFEVFERLHGNETYPGTGIGLAIVKKGVERLGGRLGVESDVNLGSGFWVELPQIKE